MGENERILKRMMDIARTLFRRERILRRKLDSYCYMPPTTDK